MIRKVKSLKFKVKSSHIVLFGLTLFLGGIFIYVIYKQLTSSLFFVKKDRINLIFYGNKTIYYSLGVNDRVHYYISFYPDVKVKVPGGYGNVRVGALGKLITLENKRDLLRKTFSIATASTVDRYFFTPSETIHYGKDVVHTDNIPTPHLLDFFKKDSNANLFDRFFIAYLFLGQKGKMSEIDYKSTIGEDQEFFQDKDFAKKYQGYVYNKIYRKEQQTVQISYRTSYKTALLISKMLEGDGIRVVDLTLQHISLASICEVTEKGTGSFSQSAIDIARFFDCSLKHGSTTNSDIILKLGIREKEWEIL